MSGRRFTALDGLRGFAALVVVVHHALLASPGLASAYREGEHVEGWARWITYTPLHIFWAGTEAVYVFFVLSGFVLALSFLGDRRASWRSYYPRRLARLYLPVWGAVAIATALFFVSDRSQPTASWWLNAHPDDLTAVGIVKDLTLAAPEGFTNSALWSLRYEVVFSLLLPAYLLVATRAIKASVVLFAGALIAVGAGAQVGSPFLLYLPMFALGVILAANRDTIRTRLGTLRSAGWSFWWISAWALLTVRWWGPGPLSLIMPLALLGSAMTVVAFFCSPPAERAGNSAVGSWLGRRSFSLYLVHEPILVTLAFALPGDSTLAAMVIGVPTSLVVSHFFFVAVEAPAHQFSKRVGRWFSKDDGTSLPAEPAAGAAQLRR